jgi:hypothetical protein
LYPNPTSCCHCWSSMTPWETTPVHTHQYSTTLYSKFTFPKRKLKPPSPKKKSTTQKTQKTHISSSPSFFCSLILDLPKIPGMGILLPPMHHHLPS